MKRLLGFAGLGLLLLVVLACGGDNDPGAADAAWAVDALAWDAALPDARLPDAGPPLWACCTIDGALCTDERSQQDCLDNGGYSFWPVTQCANHQCTNEVQGACCDQDGCQNNVTVDACSGTHHGADSLCANIVCNFTDEVPHWVGLKTHDANPKIVAFWPSPARFPSRTSGQ